MNEKKFGTQVCQFIVSLVRDSMEVKEQNDAAKKIEELRAIIADPACVYIPTDSREGKYFFAESYLSVDIRAMLARMPLEDLASSVGDYLREFYLAEWWRDEGKTILQNELWELNVFGFEGMREFAFTRDEDLNVPGSREAYFLDSLHALVNHGKVCKAILQRLQSIPKEDEDDLNRMIAERMLDGTRGMWVTYKACGRFDRMTYDQTFKLMSDTKRQMEIFVRQLSTIIH